MSQDSIEQIFQTAVQRHQRGEISQAESMYREVLARQPEHAGALYSLGLIAQQLGRHEEAVELIRRSIAARPGNAQAYVSLGIALRSGGMLEEAIGAYRQAIAIDPNHARGHYNLGNALRDGGQLEAAVEAYRRAIAVRADFAEAHNNLGNALKNTGRIDEGLSEYRRALEINPKYVEAQYNFAGVLKELGRLDEAIEWYRRAIALRPGFVEAYGVLGGVLRDAGRKDEAIEALRRAVELKPGEASLHSDLGNALWDRNRVDEATAAFRGALEIKPDDADALNHLAGVLKDQGELDKAIAAFRRALALRPDDAQIHSNLIFTMLYHPGYDAAGVAQEQRRWEQAHGEPLRKFIQSRLNDRDPQRRLRVGYVSADFRNHPVGRLMVPLLENRDKGVAEVFGYSQSSVEDEISKRLRAGVDHWRKIAELSDEAAAERIREDRIDILVDLGMHTGGNRLLVFARKPAPVQVTWLGYPGGTGLSAIDYRFSDGYLDPPGADDEGESEKPIRLSGCFWCYDPMEGRDVEAGDLPALASGGITFGYLGNFCKINSTVLGMWAAVLREVKGSRLVVLSEPGTHVQRMVDRLGREGVDAARVEIVGHRPRREYLEIYHRIDIGLDSLPYNGHTTTLDSLWMGVPVVSEAGQTAVGRGGLSILSNVGLPELVGKSREDFVRIAVGLAGDVGRLKELRSTLRGRMEKSPLMDGASWARDVEGAYRRMWRRWCAASGGPE